MPATPHPKDRVFFPLQHVKESVRLSEAKAVTGTELKIITPAATEVLGPEVDRLATLHTNARTDTELLKVWLKSHQDGSAHTIRVYKRVGERFLGALAAAGSDLRKATVEDVQAALQAMRSKEDGSPVRPATVNTYVATVKSFLGFAHRVGYTRFNAAPLIKLKKAPRQIAQRIMGELEVHMLIRTARPDRDKLMLETAYFGGLRVSELVSLIHPPRQRRGAALGRGQRRQGSAGADPT
jgi:site-specific recombinase XerC